MLDDFRRHASRFADFPIGGVVFELEREEFEGKRIKISEGRVTRVPISASFESGPRVTRPSERMASRKRAAKFESSWFMRFLFAGWFSATAEGHYSVKTPLRQARLPQAHCGAGLPMPRLSVTLCFSMNKRFYITTAIDYVNGQPHLGHAYEKIVADVIARSRRSLGQEVFFLTGLDEHGQKVQQAAQAEGKTPQAYCDELAADWQAFAKKLELTNDDFVRTTEPRHKEFVQAILARLHAAGQFYKATYKGFYSTKEETFLTDKDRLPDGTFDPAYGEVIELKEDNYWFKLREHQQWLIDYLEANPSFVQPDYRRNEVLGFLKNNTLEDLCISRPAARLNWGIPLPFDKDFVTYVWFDALVNYISIPAAHGDPTVLSALPSPLVTRPSNSRCGPPTSTSSARTF